MAIVGSGWATQQLCCEIFQTSSWAKGCCFYWVKRKVNIQVVCISVVVYLVLHGLPRLTFFSAGIFDASLETSLDTGRACEISH